MSLRRFGSVDLLFGSPVFLFGPAFPDMGQNSMKLGIHVSAAWFGAERCAFPARRPCGLRIGRQVARWRVLMAMGAALVTEEVPGASWYVDNAAPNSGNDGLSWASAWTNLSSVAWGPGGVVAGDTLFVSGGQQSKLYTDTLAVRANGASGAPIRIALDAANTNHNGVAIFDYGFAGEYALFEAITCQRDYVTIDGNVNGQNHLVIRNLVNSTNAHAAFGIYAIDTTGLVVDHVTFTNCGNPVYLPRGSNFRISNCEMRGVRGDAAISAGGSVGSWDANIVCSNVLEMLFNLTPPPGVTGFYGGPDGVQCTDGISIFANVFLESRTSAYTSTQHPDMIQTSGNYVKIYGNEFINVGDSVIDYDCWANPNPHDLWVYNNVFRIQETIDAFPEYFRLYASFNSVNSITNLKILNNTFVDNPSWTAITLNTYGGQPAAAGNEIKNNIFLNCGTESHTPAIYVQNSCNFMTNSFTFEGNLYYQSSRPVYVEVGPSFMAAQWTSQFEPYGATLDPGFVRYTPCASDNDFHLSANQTAAVNRGADLSSYFTTDKDGVSRQRGPRWDSGAFQYTADGPVVSNLPPVVTPILQETNGLAPPGSVVKVVEGMHVRYSASASDPEGALLNWQWLLRVDDGPETVLQTNSGPVTPITFTYPLGSAGSRHTWTLRASDGFATTESHLVVTVSTALPEGIAPPIEAEAGLIESPFQATNGYIWQTLATPLEAGGRATYRFDIINEGDYVIQATAYAPGFSQRALGVNIDAEPKEPDMVWNVPLTSGFERQLVSWTGQGNCNSAEFSPKVFHLGGGAHQLIIRGRDPNVLLDSVRIVVFPQAVTLPATNINSVSASLQGQAGARGSAAEAYFEYGMSADYEWSTPKMAVGSGLNVVTISNLISGLNPQEAYHFRMAVFNDAVTNFGSDLTFATPRASTLSSAKWSNGCFSVAVPTISTRTYFLERQQSLGPGSWRVVTNTLGNDQTQILTDPAARAPYNFYRVRELNLPLIEILPAADIANASALLGGRVNPAGIATTAWFDYGTSTKYGLSTAPISLPPTNVFLAISNLVVGLRSGTLYHFRLTACNFGTTNHSADAVFITTPLPPVQVRSAGFLNGQFTVSFDTLDLQHYALEYVDDLQHTNWMSITNVVGDGTVKALADPSPRVLQRYYRLSRDPSL